MKPNDFKSAKTFKELMHLAPPGSAIMVMLYGETEEESHGELVTVMLYNLAEEKVVFTSVSMLYKTMILDFEPGRFATSSWIDLTTANFSGLIGEHFRTLGKMAALDQKKEEAVEAVEADYEQIEFDIPEEK